MPLQHVWIVALLQVACGRPLFDGRSIASYAANDAPNTMLQTSNDANATHVTTNGNTTQNPNIDTHIYSPNETLVAADCHTFGYPFNTTKAGNANALTGGRTLDLALDSSGNPVVAWLAQNSNGRPQVYVQSWHATGWMGLGGSSGVFVNDGISGVANDWGQVVDLTLALDRDDVPGVLWQNFNNTEGRAFYQQWNGSAWVSVAGATMVGSSIAPNNTVPHASLAFSGPGAPFVSVLSTNAQHVPMLYVAALVANGWSILSAPPAASGATVTQAALGADTVGNVAMLYSNGALYGAEYSPQSGTWSPVGPSLTRSVTSHDVDDVQAAVAVDNANRVIVAYQDSTPTGMPNVYLVRWNGNAWEQLGGSNIQGGVSQSVSGIQQFSLAVDPQGNPALAWQDQALQQIFVRHWNGTLWETLGAGRGLSAAASYASEPRVRFAPDGSMVLAWKENDYYVRVCKIAP